MIRELILLLLMNNMSTITDRQVPKEWKLILTFEEIQKCVKKCARIIDTQFFGKELIMVCILKGAVPFFVDLCREIKTEHSWYFIESSSYHDKQQQSKCNIMGSIEPSKFIGKHVVLVDELYDGGLTMATMRKSIHEKADVPYEKIYTCVLFRKNKLTAYASPDLYGLNLPDVWLVGMGLDFFQKMRNLKNLYATPKDEEIAKSDDDKIFYDEEYYQKVRQKLLGQLENF